MQITDAVWEQRNLGVSCYEIKIEHQDTLEDVSRKYDELTEKQYMVVRIPSDCHWAVGFFQDRGYRFIEAALTITHKFDLIPELRKTKKIFSRCSYSEMTEKDISQLYDEIDKGIFKTDRIYLDPYFKKELAAQRYKNWIGDLISKGGYLYKATLDDEAIGFFSSTQIQPGVIVGALGGVYSAFEGTGYGVCVQYAAHIFSMDHNIKKASCKVSGNNIGIIEADLMLGDKISGVEYVFIKHN